MSDKEDLEITRHIVECLESTPIAVLSTNDNLGPWATPIYFTYDDKFNFYLLSEASTRHVRHIKFNPKVALAIVMPADMCEGLEVGIQIAGTAKQVPNRVVAQVFAKRGLRLIERTEKVLKSKNDKGNNEFFIKITPKMINYLDRRYHGADGHRISIEKLVKLRRHI